MRTVLARLACAIAWACLLGACGGDEDPKLGSDDTGDTGTSANNGAGATGAGASASTTSSGPGGGATGGTGTGGGTGGSGPTNNGFPASWPNGTDCAGDPDVFVWKYSEDTFILRQSLCTHFEGPFWYLLFGDQKALLEDTGTGDVDTSVAVMAVVQDWLAATGKPSIELIVTNSHGHGDHVGGNGYFTGLPGVIVVGPSKANRESFFGITSWPTQIVQYDLGGRVLDVIPIPGHQTAHIALYDRRHDLLLTGDTLYPGRLYISTWAEYRESVPRLVDFVTAGNPVTWVLGTHIEMTTTAGQDFAFGADQHPNEHALQLGYDVLVELNDAVAAMGNSPSLEVHDHFIIYP